MVFHRDRLHALSVAIAEQAEGVPERSTPGGEDRQAPCRSDRNSREAAPRRPSPSRVHRADLITIRSRRQILGLHGVQPIEMIQVLATSYDAREVNTVVLTSGSAVGAKRTGRTVSHCDPQDRSQALWTLNGGTIASRLPASEASRRCAGTPVGEHLVARLRCRGLALVVVARHDVGAVPRASHDG